MVPIFRVFRFENYYVENQQTSQRWSLLSLGETFIVPSDDEKYELNRSRQSTGLRRYCTYRLSCTTCDVQRLKQMKISTDSDDPYRNRRIAKNNTYVVVVVVVHFEFDCKRYGKAGAPETPETPADRRPHVHVVCLCGITRFWPGAIVYRAVVGAASTNYYECYQKF